MNASALLERHELTSAGLLVPKGSVGRGFGPTLRYVSPDQADQVLGDKMGEREGLREKAGNVLASAEAASLAERLGEELAGRHQFADPELAELAGAFSGARMGMGNTFVVNCNAFALTASATKSTVLLDPASSPATTVIQLDGSFDQSVAETAINAQLYVVSTVGSPAGTSATVNKLNQNLSGGALTSALTTLTTEPTTKVILATWYIQPYGGLFVVQWPLGREPVMAGQSATTRLGFQYVTQSGATGNSCQNAYFEE